MSLTPEDQKAIVDAHNAYRSDPAINAPSLQWSNDLATGAQSWAENLATNVHALQHSTSAERGYHIGENIAAAGGKTPAKMVDQWGAEQGNFIPGIFSTSTTTCPVSKTGNWQQVGHYTQVIWNDTTSVGCGFASDGSRDYLVCRYDPAGNMPDVQIPKLVVLPFQDNDVITLQADNGYAWVRFDSSASWWNPVEARAIESTYVSHTKYRVTILGPNRIALKGDNNYFLSRVNRGKDLDPIESYSPSTDVPYSQFTVMVLESNLIALKADNGLYLSRVDRGSQQPIEAAKSSIDDLCKFTVAVSQSA